jgi:hypothetical protein
MKRSRRAGFKAVPTGIAHGTVTVVVEGTPFEVTTLREDVETDGRRAVVRFGRDFDADARRRDFTMNALSLDARGRLYDPVGGLADLEARRVRFIGDPATRIRDNYLRTLRFFRFHADYGEGRLDAAGLAAAIAERDGLARLSRERVRAEFLCACRPAGGRDRGATGRGGLTRLVTGAASPSMARLARAVASGAPGDAVPRPGALSVAVAEDAERLRQRLRLATSEYERLAGLARLVAMLHAMAAPLDRPGHPPPGGTPGRQAHGRCPRHARWRAAARSSPPTAAPPFRRHGRRSGAVPAFPSRAPT